MGFLLVGINVFVLGVYQFFVKEIFTPLKFYFLYLIVLCYDITNADYNSGVYFSYFGMIFFGVLLIPVVDMAVTGLNLA